MLVRQQRDGEETALPGKQHVPGPDVSTRTAGLLGIGAAAGRGHGQPLQKQNCPFGGPQISQNQAETWYICLSKGTPQRDMPLGDRPWQSTDHRWLQDVWSEQGGHTYAEMSHLCMSLMQRCCFMSHPWVKPIPKAPVQVWAQAQHPRGRTSPTQRSKDIPPITPEAGWDPGPSSPRPFACSTSPQPRLCSLAGCWDENKVQILLLAEITSSPTVI